MTTLIWITRKITNRIHLPAKKKNETERWGRRKEWLCLNAERKKVTVVTFRQCHDQLIMMIIDDDDNDDDD